MKKVEMILKRIVLLVIALVIAFYGNCYAFNYDEDIHFYDNKNTVNTYSDNSSTNNVPKSFRDRMTQFKNEDYDFDDYEVIPAKPVKSIIKSVISLVQIFGTLLASLLIIIIVIKRDLYRKKYQNILEKEKKINEKINIFFNNIKANNEYIELTKKHKKVMTCTIVSLLAFLISVFIIVNYKGNNISIKLLPEVVFILFLIFISIKYDTRIKIDLIENRYLELINKDEISKEVIVIKEEYEKVKAHTIFYVIAAIMLFAGIGIIGLIKHFGL